MSKSYPWPAIAMAPEKVVALTRSLMDAHMVYGLGAKIAPISLQAPDLHGKAVDCSGFVRWAVWHGTGGLATLPDGSVRQHDYCETRGFKKSTVQDAHLSDGAIRIAFLSPADVGGIGHVMLIVNGETCESHGRKGPDRRGWGSEAFMAKCAVYVLTPPSA